MIYRIFFDTRKKKKKEKRTLFFDYYINKYNMNFPFLLIVRHTHTSSYMSAREESIQITGARQNLGYYIDVRNTTLRRHTYIERHTLTHTSALYYSRCLRKREKRERDTVRYISIIMGTLLRGYAIELELHGRCVSFSLCSSFSFVLV
jgi:hypothetical protein